MMARCQLLHGLTALLTADDGPSRYDQELCQAAQAAHSHAACLAITTQSRLPPGRQAEQQQAGDVSSASSSHAKRRRHAAGAPATQLCAAASLDALVFDRVLFAHIVEYLGIGSWLFMAGTSSSMRLAYAHAIAAT